MELAKLCPACGEENPVSEIICRVCMTNLSSVSPTSAGGGARCEASPGPASSSEACGEPTIGSGVPVITFSRAGDGRAIPVASGAVLGRAGEGAAYFENEKTVSRSHASVEFRDGEWRITDLASTNGTWVNGRRLEPGAPCSIKTGDRVALSMACELRVIS
jgi:hypothetical protein